MTAISKKTTVYIMAAIFVLTMCFSLISFPSKVYADFYTDSGVEYYYTAADTTATVSDYTGGGGAVTILESFEVGGVTYTITSIRHSAFLNNTGITSITIPDSVTSIGYQAFLGCTGLTDITIPNSVTSIGYSAFNNCTGLTSVTIPGNVKNIGDYLFYQCTNLTSTTISEGVNSIGNQIFFGCTSLTSANLPGSITSWGTGTFLNCSSLTSIIIQNGITSIPDRTFLGCSSLASITIPNSITSVGGYAFYDCHSLERITIPDSVTSIGDLAFYTCFDLDVVYFLGTPSLGGDLVFSGLAGAHTLGGLITKPSSLNNYIFYKDEARTEEWIFDTDTRVARSAPTLLYGVANSSSAISTSEQKPQLKPQPKPWEREDYKYYDKTLTGFTTMFYSRFFRRPPDELGLNIWVARLQSGQVTGADLVYGFIFSEENQAKISDYTDEEFITFLYKVIFTRAPEQSGLDAWLQRISAGMTREEVVAGFTHSVEFSDLCSQFGVMPYLGYVETKE